jgi:RNA-directed DNA polymerase
VIIVRFADDIGVGFQHRSDAERFQADLVQRFARFNLELNAGKTRLIEFGRFAAENRRRRGLGRPETFAFPGFTHMCGKTRTGRFALRRKTIAKKMAAKLREVNPLLRQRRHWPIPEQGQWLGSVVRGHRLLRGPRQHRRGVGVPQTGHAALGPVASAPEPAP